MNAAKMSGLDLAVALKQRAKLEVTWRLKGSPTIYKDVIPSNSATAWWLSLHKGCDYGPVFTGTTTSLSPKGAANASQLH